MLLWSFNIGTTVTSAFESDRYSGGTIFILTLMKPSSFSPILASWHRHRISDVFQDRKEKRIGAIMIGFTVADVGMETIGGCGETTPGGCA